MYLYLFCICRRIGFGLVHHRCFLIWYAYGSVIRRGEIPRSKRWKHRRLIFSPFSRRLHVAPCSNIAQWNIHFRELVDSGRPANVPEIASLSFHKFDRDQLPAKIAKIADLFRYRDTRFVRAFRKKPGSESVMRLKWSRRQFHARDNTRNDVGQVSW